MTGHSAAILAEGLTKIYGSGNAEVTAMQDVSFSLDSGEVVALLGPSGAGKSTLLTIVGLINTPTAGRLIIGKDLVTDGPSAKVNLRSVQTTFYRICSSKGQFNTFSYCFGKCSTGSGNQRCSWKDSPIKSDEVVRKSRCGAQV